MSANSKEVGSTNAEGGLLVLERHYSIQEIAEIWHLSPDCVRKIFANEPGVLVIDNGLRRRGKRSYTTLRIPESVMTRVHRRMARV